MELLKEISVLLLGIFTILFVILFLDSSIG